MIVEDFNQEKHFNILLDWWVDHKWGPFNPRMLPKVGKVVFTKDHVPVCAGFLYPNHPGGVLEWVVADPKSDHDLRDQCLDEMMAALLDEAKKAKLLFVFTSLNNKRLIGRYLKHGFIQTDTDMTNVFWANPDEINA